MVLTVLKALEIKLPFGGVGSAISRIAIVILFAFIFLLSSQTTLNAFERFQNYLEKKLKEKSPQELITEFIGLLLGLLLAFFVTQPLSLIPIPYLGVVISILVYAMFGYLGLRISSQNLDELQEKFKEIRGGTKKLETIKIPKIKGVAKVVDTSVIIDGRIKEIVAAGFLEGPLIIPEFVLEELQFIADSSDSLKRNRGRRGLDIVKSLQDDKKIEVLISDLKYEDIKEVDMKLLKLAADVKGKLITNDYNLNNLFLYFYDAKVILFPHTHKHFDDFFSVIPRFLTYINPFRNYFSLQRKIVVEKSQVLDYSPIAGLAGSVFNSR